MHSSQLDFGVHITTPFHCAAAAHDIALIRRLSRLGYDINTVNQLGETAVFQSADQLFYDSSTTWKKMVVLRTLCEEGANVNFTTNVDGDAHILFHLRDDGGLHLLPQNLPFYIGGLKLLLKHGASPSRALHAVAVHESLVPLIHILLKAGADIEEVFTDMTPLTRAVVMSNHDGIKAFIDAGANINKSGKTPTLFAAIKYALGYNITTAAILKTLCEAGADTKRVNDQNHSILSYALTRSCHYLNTSDIPAVVKILCSYGSDVNFRHRRLDCPRAEDGDTPLHFAAAMCTGAWDLGGSLASAECAEILISYGANVDSQNYAGQTPLHKAVVKSDVLCAKVLVKHGARVDLKNVVGKSAVELAEGDQAMYNILMKQQG
jgi:ankyrin repeat protein